MSTLSTQSSSSKLYFPISLFGQNVGIFVLRYGNDCLCITESIRKELLIEAAEDGKQNSDVDFIKSIALSEEIWETSSYNNLCLRRSFWGISLSLYARHVF